MLRNITIFLCVLVVGSLAHAATLPPAVRGARTVHISADRGPLSITVLKRDLNIYANPDPLTVTLYDPLGNQLLAQTMPDDGNAEKGGGRAEDYQRLEETFECPVAGVCRLTVRGSGDLVWGLETSAEHYVVQGNMFFSDGTVSGSVFFPPPEGEFTVKLTAVHGPGVQTVPVYDAADELLGEIKLTEHAEPQTLQFDAGEREGLWRLDFDPLDVRVEIKGVNHWTAQREAWFDAGKSKWMLMPYRVTRYLQPGQSAELQFDLRNSTGHADRLRVQPRSDDALDVRIVEPGMPVALDHGESAAVQVALTLADDAAEGEEYGAFLMASAEGEPTAMSTSAINVRAGESPVSEPLEMPIVLRPFAHENVQFGYDPDYMRNEVYFDAQNIPWIRQRTESHTGTTGVYTLDEDLDWVHRGFEDAIREAYPEYTTSYGGGGFAGAKVAFDGQGGIYTTLRLVAGDRRPAVLMFSPDGGRSWQVHELQATLADIEQFTGHNRHTAPPAVLGYKTTGGHPARFCAYNDLWLYLPERDGDSLVLGEPVKVAESVVGQCQHSGGPAPSVTADGKTHVVWGEVSGTPEGEGADERGVPTYAATYDHETGEVSEKVLLGYAPPVNDVHNVPAITMDSEGYLHALLGAHGQPFQYVRSLRPHDGSQWTDPEPILETGYDRGDGEQGRQTYISLVCDQDDTLHTAFRQWRTDREYHGGTNFAALSVQHRPKGGEWTAEAEPLVIAAVPGYSIWYHKLTVDRLGDLWLSYSYWTNDEGYQGQFPGRYHHRAVIVSRDSGQTWKLAETADFIEGAQLHHAR